MACMTRDGFLSSVAVDVANRFIATMWVLVYWCENLPVVSPETRSAAHGLHKE
jgi:hypothetical protein